MLNFNSIRRILSITRFKPFNTSTLAGRSDERLRRVFWTAVTSAMAKGIITITILVSVPITLGYLGSERFGLWMTISSFVAFLGFADLGIGNGLLNLISESDGKNDIQAARKGIASAFCLLLCVAICLAVIFKVLFPYINWGLFLNVSSSTAMAEAGPAIAVLLVCILVNLPLSIIPRIQNGYQEGYISSLWQGIAGLLGLVGLIIVVQLRAGLPWLILTVTGSAAIGNLLNGIHLFAFRRRFLIPARHEISISVARQILMVGFFFVILQLTNAINYSADNLIIAKILGPTAVTDYAVPIKLFSIISTVVYMVLAPLWPAYGEASARGDVSWAIHTLKKVVSTTVILSGFASLILIVFGSSILQVWTGAKVAFSLPLMISFGLWTTLQLVITSVALFLNAINKISCQALFAILTAIFSVLARILLARSNELIGIVWGNILPSFFLMLIPYSVYLFKRYANPMVNLQKG